MAQPNRRDRQTPELSEQDARQGEVILRSRGRRTIFIAGLVGIVLIVFVGLALS